MSLQMQKTSSDTVADTGFPRGEGANPRGLGGRQHTILPNFPKIMHEIERIRTPGVKGEACPSRTRLRSATGKIIISYLKIDFK